MIEIDKEFLKFVKNLVRIVPLFKEQEVIFQLKMENIYILKVLVNGFLMQLMKISLPSCLSKNQRDRLNETEWSIFFQMTPLII